MRRRLVLGTVSLLAVVLVASTVIATHGLPRVEGSGTKVSFFVGPNQLEPDEPFHIRHGWSEIVVDKAKHEDDFYLTVRAKTGADVDNQFAVGTYLSPALSNCDPAFGDQDCRQFLFDVPGGGRDGLAVWRWRCIPRPRHGRR